MLIELFTILGAGNRTKELKTCNSYFSCGEKDNKVNK